MADPGRPEDAERQLAAASRDVKTLVRWIEQLEEQRSQDVETLARWVRRLDAGVSNLLNSRRWKLGNAIGDLGDKVLRKKSAPAGLDDLGEIGEKLRTRHEEFRAQQREFRTRREEFLARRGYLEPSKGRPGTIESEELQTPNSGANATSLDRRRFEPGEHILQDLRRLQPVTIIVPVHDAYEDLKGCLESVAANTTAPAKLLLIDDASTDPGVSSLLAEYAALENVRVLTNDEHLGQVKTVNRGLSESGGDAILLDGDAEVTPRWVENLALAAYADPRTATVTAISLPTSGEANGFDRDGAGRRVTQQSAQVYPQTPAGNGSCTYVKRAALDDVGMLDAESFDGRGGALDFCMRAQKRGWNHVIDDATVVFREKSEGGVSEAEREVFDELHPEYAKLARALAASEDMERAIGNARAAYEESGRVWTKPRVLYVLFQGGGGTPFTARDLMDALDDRYSSYVLVSDTLRLKLFRHEAGKLVPVEEWNLGRKWRITEFSRPDYRAIVFDLLVKYRFEMVHVKHLLGHTFDLPEIARRLRIPVVLTFHDFYFSCPTMHLIDDHEEHCGGVCTPGYGECRLPKMLVGEVPALKHRWLKTWRQNVERVFEHVDAFTTASFATREIYLRSFPGLQDREFEVIEHGRDLNQERLAVPPGEGPIRILMPGNMEVHKGARFLRALKQLDAEGRLEFHFLGNVVEGFRDLGVTHGFYEREEFDDRVREIRPSFMGIFSIWPEIYCHTLTESWAVGVPVLASDIGTLKERVEAHGGGWLLDYRDPRRSYERIFEIAGDPAEYARELERADLRGIRSTKEMADDHEDLYENALREHRPFERPAS